jgi:electron-transferring-flavoprotein dehydrogenase
LSEAFEIGLHKPGPCFSLWSSLVSVAMLGCRTATRPLTIATRLLHSSSRRFSEPFNPAAIERAEDEVDVCIVGGGPAGISAAIRLKQLEREKGNEIRVVVLEKGSEVG